MKHYAQIYCLFAFLLLLMTPCAAQATGNTQTEIDEVLELYGAKGYTEQLPGKFLASLDQQQAQLDPEVYRVLRNAFEFAFTSEKLYHRLATSFAEQAERADAQQLSRTLVWLQTPLSRKMTALKLAANTLEAAEAIQQYGATLESQPPPQPRRALIEQLDGTLDASRLALDLQAIILRTLLEGANPLLPEERQPDGTQIDLQIIDMKLQLLGLVRERVKVSMLYTYREVSDEELTEYLAYWRTDDGHWLNGTTSRALLAAIEEAGHEAGVLISLQGVDISPQ